ncbi:MAG: hypothetical protein HGA75_03595 [Thiobacillus sp.]|nr:hypothetical protein [Thiobacillus sp.]
MKRNVATIFILIPNLALGGSLIGTVVPPYPHGVESKGGACISDPAAPERSCAFGIELMRENGSLYLYLQKTAPQVEPNKPRWLILDRMPYPRTKPGEDVIFAMCELDGKPDQSLIAVVRRDDTEWHTAITKAFRGNLVKERFERTSTAGIRCVNQGWGI